MLDRMENMRENRAMDTISPADVIKAYAEVPRLMAEVNAVRMEYLMRLRAAEADATLQNFKERADAAGFTKDHPLVQEMAKQLPDMPAMKLPEFDLATIKIPSIDISPPSIPVLDIPDIQLQKP